MGLKELSEGQHYCIPVTPSMAQLWDLGVTQADNLNPPQSVRQGSFKSYEGGKGAEEDAQKRWGDHAILSHKTRSKGIGSWTQDGTNY